MREVTESSGTTDASEGEDSPYTPRYTRDELIEKLGVSAEFAEKAWNAFGFARR